MVVMLPDPFRGMGEWRNSTEAQQSGHAPRSEPEVKMEVVPKTARRKGSDAGQSEIGKILQMMSADVVRKILLLFYPA